jgi:hypothetical protein
MMPDDSVLDRVLRVAAASALVLAVASLVSVLFNIWLGARPIGQISVLVAFSAWATLKIRKMRRPMPGESGTADSEGEMRE